MNNDWVEVTEEEYYNSFKHEDAICTTEWYKFDIYPQECFWRLRGTNEIIAKSSKTDMWTRQYFIRAR